LVVKLAVGVEAMSGVTRRCLFAGAIAIILGGLLARLPAGAGERMRVAISGYDPVAYFTDGHPVRGAVDFSFSYDDSVYYFASAEHRKLFVADPDRYAPYYSGYCALGIAEGAKYEANPEYWIISDGRLFLFVNKPATATFIADAARNISKADANWTALKDKN
jgi:YHS domain-containing protein